MIVLRNDGRSYDEIRPVKMAYDPFGYADSSLLFEIGETKVLVSISLQKTVPSFLKGKNSGWLTAEYSMLPASTRSRVNRESSSFKRNFRSIEISRLIGRSLRAVVDLAVLGERTIVVDCDVLQADGGTRVAAITAASAALRVAEERWLERRVIEKSFVRSDIAAISVGIVRGHAYLDLSQEEDNISDVDFNFVLTRLGEIVEIQGTSEKRPISWENFELLKKLALRGVADLFEKRSFLNQERGTSALRVER